MNHTLYWLWLSLCLGQGNPHFTSLLERFGSPDVLYRMSSEELITLEREFGSKTVERLLNKNLDAAYSLEEYCVKKSVNILCYGQEDYPKPLTNLKNPPIILYARGQIAKIAGKLCIGVVGTRSMTAYGRDAAYRMGFELASAGAVVVSGLARGIDSAAACGALDAGGVTVAVLGSGVDHVYPSEHERLAHEIEEKGVVLSEYVPTATPNKFTFPMRNRIISGLSQGTVVIEAPAHSGALITARDAILQGREVFALPGNVGSPGADGTNDLIKDGAAAVTSASDILEGYAYLYRNSLNPAEAKRVSACAGFARGKMAAHGVSEEEVPVWNPNERKRPLSDVLHVNKQVDGETVRKLSGETEYPIFGEAIASERSPENVPESGFPERKEKESTSDHSAERLAGLPEDCRAVFEAMPLGEPVSADEMCRAGFGISQVMIAFTMLEVAGLVSALPGGLYCRR